jgi:hypothetical protein
MKSIMVAESKFMEFPMENSKEFSENYNSRIQNSEFRNSQGIPGILE